MFMKFISAGEPEYTTIVAEGKEKALGRTWILFCPENLRVLVLFVAIRPNTPDPSLGEAYQIIPFGGRSRPVVEGFVGCDRQDGRRYRILPCPAMSETGGGA